nr:MAG TPA: hypothetical protein [Caudoviricetes sp.]
MKTEIQTPESVVRQRVQEFFLFCKNRRFDAWTPC